jgi:hypothetical protein
MPDRESQSDVNPGRVERGLDRAATQGAENTANPEPGDRVAGTSGNAPPAPREDPAPGGGLS